MKKKLFCFGLGYSARNLVQHLKQQDTGWQFSGSCRQQTDRDAAHIFDGNSPMVNSAEILSDITHMLISIPPQNIDPVLHHHGREISKLKNLKWLGYLSTTGIYGDRGGDWVDDNSPPAPTSARGRQRLKAETGWLELFHDHGLPVHIFRLGSIYGPGKGQLANLLAGGVKKIIQPGQYFSRIHVADIMQVLTASIQSPNPGRSYNVVDDLPTANAKVLDHICDLLGRPHLPPVNINDTEISPLMRSFYGENKRVRNDRIKQELGVTLKYPTYKEGFSALIRNL
ncbi:Nucleoside-diphosphate-sugar epimerases [hydrothermal vent metagenome]|uniref:Nucleoside-diphosphate-sugar epimerases n=1 Tax=hydrothermal vent metagenome TaxID=652676 RepID=A0A3B0REE4_9ZZZZ